MLLAAVGSKTARVGDVLEVLQRLVAERLEELRAQTSTYPGVDALLARLAEAGVRQTVVTGNIAAIARHKLEAGSLIPPIAPDFGGYGDSALDRAAVARVAIDRLAAAGWHPGLDEVWIVGDTPRDLACARAVGVHCALVATGRNTLEELSGLGADIVLPDLADPRLISFESSCRLGCCHLGARIKTGLVVRGAPPRGRAGLTHEKRKAIGLGPESNSTKCYNSENSCPMRGCSTNFI